MDTETVRPQFRQPNEVGGIVYATDCYSCLLVEASLPNLKYEAHECTPDFEGIKRDMIEVEGVVFYVSDLKSALNKLPKQPVKIKCDDCQGEGACFHCGADCDYCRGTGLVDSDDTFEHGGDKTGIAIEKNVYRASQMDKLLKVCVSLHAEKFSLKRKREHAIVIEVGGVNIYMARVSDRDSSDRKIEKLTPINN